MFAWGRAVRAASGRGAPLGRALEGTMSLLGADRGNVQLRAGRMPVLRIVTQTGFDSDFLEHFAVVADGSSACGRAARGRAPIVIADVMDDESFEPHRRIAAASRFRAVLSVPFVDGADGLLGVMSVHFREAHAPSSQDLVLIEWYAEEIGQVLGRTTPVTDELQLSGSALSESAAADGADGPRGSERRLAAR
jgi:GAF domain-containing protein